MKAPSDMPDRFLDVSPLPAALALIVQVWSRAIWETPLSKGRVMRADMRYGADNLRHWSEPTPALDEALFSALRASAALADALEGEEEVGALRAEAHAALRHVVDMLRTEVRPSARAVALKMDW